MSNHVIDNRIPELRPPANPVERRAALWWLLQSLAWWGAGLAASIVAYVWWETARPWLVVAIVGTALLLLVGVLVEPWWRLAVHRWEFNGEAVYARTGWLVREWRVAPISRIQTVDAVRGPLEQLMGLATLRVTTASSKGALEIVGLDHTVAAEVAEQLNRITQQTPGDAT